MEVGHLLRESRKLSRNTRSPRRRAIFCMSSRKISNTGISNGSPPLMVESHAKSRQMTNICDDIGPRMVDLILQKWTIRI